MMNGIWCLLLFSKRTLRDGILGKKMVINKHIAHGVNAKFPSKLTLIQDPLNNCIMNSKLKCCGARKN